MPRVLASSETLFATPRRTQDRRAADTVCSNLKENVMFFTYKIPISVVLLAMLVVFFFATGQLP